MVARAREGIHPKLFKSKVIVNGETVDEITGTQEEYHVDVWSGNHPFYQGDTRALVLDEGQARPPPPFAVNLIARRRMRGGQLRAAVIACVA